jgi:hypothetical protein
MDSFRNQLLRGKHINVAFPVWTGTVQVSIGGITQEVGTNFIDIESIPEKRRICIPFSSISAVSFPVLEAPPLDTTNSVADWISLNRPNIHHIRVSLPLWDTKGQRLAPFGPGTLEDFGTDFVRVKLPPPENTATTFPLWGLSNFEVWAGA